MKERGRQIERQQNGKDERCVNGRTFSFNTTSETLHYKPEKHISSSVFKLFKCEGFTPWMYS